MCFKFAFKRELRSLYTLFLVIKTHITNLVYIIIINIIFNILMCFSFSTNFINFLQDDIMHCMINNSIVLFLSVKYPFSCGVIPVVCSRPDFRILSTKVSQHLALISWIPGAMDNTSLFGSILRMIYIPFPVLYSSLIHLRVSILWGSLCSHFPAVTSTVVILPSRFFIRRFYDTFINRFWYLQTFKHVNSWF